MDGHNHKLSETSTSRAPLRPETSRVVPCWSIPARHNARCWSTLLAGGALAVAGCITSPERMAEGPEAAAQQMAARPVDRSGDNYEWIKRLKATEPVEVRQQIAAPGSQVVFPVPVPYTAAGQYQLVINQVMRLAWLQTSEGLLGPWSMEHPDVRHLVESVAIPPTNPQATQ